LIRTEKLAKHTKLRTDQQIRSRAEKGKLNPQDEALRVSRTISHESISSVTQTVGGKTTLTTNPEKVKTAIADYFFSHLGITGPAANPAPPRLEKELQHDTYKDTYSLDKPFTAEELYASLVTAKNSAAPGKDGIPISLIKFAIIHAPEKSTAASEITLAIAQAIYDGGGRHAITKQIVCKPLYKKAGDTSPPQTFAQ
jgi:hypothetical protein